MKKTCLLVLFFAFLTACEVSVGGEVPVGGAGTTASPATATGPVDLPTVLSFPEGTPTVTFIPSSTPDTRLSPERWQEWPVLPIVRPEMKVIFQRGIEFGNNPTAFSKIGDGEISTVWFLTQYDLAPSNYHLGSYTDLQFVIKHFSGSFGRVGLAAGRSYNTTIILGPVSAGMQECNPGESHLDCELRIHHPSFAFISLGTNQVWRPEIFESELRLIIERLLEADVVPILATKADNLEGDYRINQIIAQLAYEYNLPLWNFWLAVQPLPQHGLQDDMEHLTYADSDFSNATDMLSAWPWRNLTALQVLDSVYHAVTGHP